MFQLKNLPIKQKLMFISMMTSIVALLLASMSFVIYETITSRQGMVQEFSSLAEIIGSNSTSALSINDSNAAKKILMTLDAKPMVTSSCIYTIEEEIFTQYHLSSNEGICPGKPEMGGHIFKEDHLELFQEIVLDGKRIGTIYLQSDLHHIHDRMMRHVGIGIVSFIFCSLAALLLSSKLQGIISRPIMHLTEVANLVSTKKDYAIRAVQENQDELGLFVTQFNEMLTQIQNRDVTLEKARSILEDKVKERTEALQQEVIERRQTEAALRESEERYAIAIRGAKDGLWDWNLKDDTIYFSPRWKKMLGYEESKIGTSPDEWFNRIHAQDRERVMTAINGHRSGSIPHFEQEHRMLHNDGSYRWVLSRGLAIREADGTATRMAGSQTDITAKKFAEDQLRYDAFHDKLTSLPNRALFLDRLGGAINRAKRRKDYLFAVLYLDLDRFKIVNDSLGHAIGDELLIAIGNRLDKAVRSQDSVAYLGGDEFTILLDELNDVNDALRLTRRLREDMNLPFNLLGHEIFITVSIGIVLSTHQHKQPEDLLRDADTAMFRAKSLGPAREQLFDSGMHVHAMKQLKLESDLRRAIGNDELLLHYQPIVSLESGYINGFEALLRWQHPDHGIVSPSEFIPIAEETGLIVSIGEWVFQKACHQIASWQRQFPEFPPLTITVNLSGKQFVQTNLISKVNHILQEACPEPNTVGLEITESVIMDNAENSTTMLNLLRDLGIRLYMDDFGTGYSSLSYIHRFPIDVLKIDRSFVSRLGDTSNQGNIIEAIITLAHNQEMVVVAEGIETTKQLDRLKSLGCEYGQGYLFSHPLDEEGIETLLLKQAQWKTADTKDLETSYR